ncbi:hypothetical protein [Knoellia aerolata]|uniref:Uncharacterized protein n=1 Tax=Knoellia aerolata DSM 18566 TaxID=1385519 RepID=A0A0A0K1S0_9MICO|nr:hypothetical protein [Knoellia aerolata]KGN42277.1 hypothetical protein N801_00475 [Knoellia aerolata DSM 18566]
MTRRAVAMAGGSSPQASHHPWRTEAVDLVRASLTVTVTGWTAP